MKNALIFAPFLEGHRQLYVFVLQSILSELKYKVFIAANTQGQLINSFYLDTLRANSAVTILDTSHYPLGGLKITLTDLISLQNECNADLTILPEADHHLSLLTAQIFRKKNKLKGRVVGLFMRPFYYYRKTSFLDKLRFIKNIASRWSTDERLFFDFFLKRFPLLDEALTIDENYVHHHPKFTWLPDVFQKYADLIENTGEKIEQRQWINKLDTFVSQNKNRFLFLYFGTAQHRRGYDTLLELARETGGCFIHCGLKKPDVKFRYNTDEIISILKENGRYFETNEFIEDPFTIEYFFKAVPYLILPYQNFFGSSGVMLQALELGIPVLGPDTGIIGYRIEKYNLGMTFTEANMASLKSQFKILKEKDPQDFKKDIKSYMQYQSAEQLKNTLINSFSDSKMKVLMP